MNQYKSYLKNEIGTRWLVHNKRMFILSDLDCISNTNLKESYIRNSVEIGLLDVAGYNVVSSTLEPLLSGLYRTGGCPDIGGPDKRGARNSEINLNSSL